MSIILKRGTVEDGSDGGDGGGGGGGGGGVCGLGVGCLKN